MAEPTGFSKAKQTAEKLSQQQDKVRKILEEALTKAEKQKQRILDFWDDLQTLIRMVKAYVNGEYTEIPWKTIITAVAAIIYFLNPLDIIPDLVPALGFLDDATVIAFAVNSLKEDLEKFRKGQSATVYAESNP